MKTRIFTSASFFIISLFYLGFSPVSAAPVNKDSANLEITLTANSIKEEWLNLCYWLKAEAKTSEDYLRIRKIAARPYWDSYYIGEALKYCIRNQEWNAFYEILDTRDLADFDHGLLSLGYKEGGEVLAKDLMDLGAVEGTGEVFRATVKTDKKFFGYLLAKGKDAYAHKLRVAAGYNQEKAEKLVLLQIRLIEEAASFYKPKRRANQIEKIRTLIALGARDFDGAALQAGNADLDPILVKEAGSVFPLDYLQPENWNVNSTRITSIINLVSSQTISQDDQSQFFQHALRFVVKTADQDIDEDVHQASLELVKGMLEADWKLPLNEKIWWDWGNGKIEGKLPLDIVIEAKNTQADFLSVIAELNPDRQLIISGMISEGAASSFWNTSNTDLSYLTVVLTK